MTKLQSGLAATLVLLMLGGCATTGEGLIPGGQQLPRDAAGWSVQGKAALTDAEGTQTVSVHWLHPEVDRDQVRLAGPLGAGAIELFREGERLYWLKDGIEQPLNSLPLGNDARRAALNLPMTTISEWLLGYPQDVDSWSVSITEWQRIDAWTLPRKITASRPDMSVKLVLLTWDLVTPP